jgi:hypothetical protein
MNKLKNIGISALAGTLVSLSAAQAGGVSVTGSWELTYTQLDNDETAGNKIGMNKNVTFGASGDLTDGGGVTWASTIATSDSMGLTSASLSINMGGIATLAYDSGTGSYGANSVDNIVPTAWEEIDAGFSTGITDVGAVSASKGVVNLTIKAPGSGTAISISHISRMGGTHVADGGTEDPSGGRGIDAYFDLVNVSMSQFAFRLGTAAQIEMKDFTCNDLETTDATNNRAPDGCVYNRDPWAGTAYASAKLGPLSLGVQTTYKDPETVAEAGIANNHSWVAGIAMNVGSNFSVSYGRGTDIYTYNDATRGEGENVHAHYEGYSAAVNVGPAALKYFTNSVDHLNGGANGDSQSELNLSIAF